MSVNTITSPVTPELDTAELDTIGAGIADDIILTAAAAERVKRVKGTGRARGAVTVSGESRAWTMGGDVD